MTKNKLMLFLALCLLFALPAKAAEVEMNMALMQAMDKITGRVNIIEVPVGGMVNFGTFSIVVRSCMARTEEDVPENFAFVDVADKTFDQEEYNIFKGWMLSSSPALNAVEHPIYDIWLLKCFNGTPKKELLLSDAELEKRDSLPRINEYVAQTRTLGESTFKDEAEENIFFKDAMYKEEPAPDVQNMGYAKTDGEPQNLLNIVQTDENNVEEIVVFEGQTLSRALTDEAEKLQNQEIYRLEQVAGDSLQEDEVLMQEIDAELEKHR